MRKLENEEINILVNAKNTTNQLWQRCEPHRQCEPHGQNFGKVYTPKSDISEGAKGNKDFQKETKRFFDEKRV
jgi:hypothetical protein